MEEGSSIAVEVAERSRDERTWYSSSGNMRLKKFGVHKITEEKKQ